MNEEMLLKMWPNKNKSELKSQDKGKQVSRYEQILSNVKLIKENIDDIKENCNRSSK